MVPISAGINRYSDVSRSVSRAPKGSDHIDEIYIPRTYLGLGRMRSIERLRQWLDETGAEVSPEIVSAFWTMLKRLNVTISGHKKGFVPQNIEVFPKKAIPMPARRGELDLQAFRWGMRREAVYLGNEGWFLEIELLPVGQHSQEGFASLFLRVPPYQPNTDNNHR